MYCFLVVRQVGSVHNNQFTASSLVKAGIFVPAVTVEGLEVFGDDVLGKFGI
jgi:hypothetical protein